jgi:uncharacterized protein YcbK (DUF882 family)
MQPSDWDHINHFDPSENWGDPSMMDSFLVHELDRLRAYIGRKIVIHCGYEARDGKGYHPKGLAVDCHASGLHPMEFYIAASRFKGFGGIGIYPWWNRPGLHLDCRQRLLGSTTPRALWGSIGPKQYVPFDTDFLKHCMGVE